MTWHRQLGLLLALLAGCGRYGFDTQITADVAVDLPGDAVDATGLVARYAMDNDPSAGSVPGSPATYSAACAPCPVATTGRIGGGYQFDQDLRITLPTSNLVGLAPFTVMVWIKPTAGSTLYSIVNKPLDLVTVRNVFSLTLDSNNGQVGFETSIGGNIVSFPATSPDLRGTWHHVAASWDGSVRRLYVDGALIGMDPGAFEDGSLELGFGADLDGNAPSIFYRGALDELRFYDRALADAEIALLAAPP